MKVTMKPEMSMVNPSTDKLMTKVDSRYGLVVCAAKRARQLIDGAESEIIHPKCNKPLSIAVEELYRGDVKIVTDDEE